MLAMVMLAEISFKGSATLCAVTVTLGEFGRIGGAVKLPLESSEPHATGHEAPASAQRTDVFGCPALEMEAWNGCIAPSSTDAGLGERATVISLAMVMMAEACLLGSAILCAATMTVVSAGRIAGAV